MESIGDSWYRIEAGSCQMVIFNDNGTNDGDKRTNDVSIPDGKNAFYFKGKDYNADRGDWGIYVETTWTIVGVAAIINGNEWTTDTEANDMVKGADGKYTLIVEKTNLAAGNYDYKVAKNHSWDGSYPASGNQTLTISEAGDYTIVYTYDGESSLTATATKKVTKVETPTFSVAGGTYHAAQSVEIACATDGATIYYTTDGNNPTTSSTQYTGAIAVNATTTLKAIAAKDGMTASDVASATYTIELPQTGRLYIKVGDGAYTEMDASDGNFTWQGDINNEQIIKFSSNGTDDEAFHFASTTAYDYEVNASFYSNNEVAFGAGNDYIMKWGNGNYTITVPADYSNVTFVQNSVEKTYTIYYKGNYRNAYIWIDSSQEWKEPWPGEAMTQDGDWYKIVLKDEDKDKGYNRIIFNNNDNEKTGNLTIPESLWETGEARYDTDHWVINPNTGVLYVKFGEDGTYTLMSKDTDGNFTWTGDINNDVVIKFRSKDNSDDNYHLHPSGSGDYWVNETNHNDDLTFGAGSNYLMKWGNGNYTITVPADYSMVSFTKNAGYIENGIPVYPIGVQSETELKKYDFENNPAIYLQCKVLNDERVSPEWQMIKGDDGKYHLNGFAMRGTTCRDADGDKDIEALAFVRVYDADGTHTAGSFKLDKSAYLTNGELYNATFDPETNTLSLTEDETAQGHMPFISLVGNEMKQDQNYTTPRNSRTDSAWQEAWIQYDENGNILKDREDNVMYSTMWPPKNPIYFTANIGGERLYSSEQMTFKVDNNFTAKTGAEWKEQLTGDEYTGLVLDDNTNYVRYVVPDIWFVGQAKIWTGWGGQTTYSYGNPIAQWSNHANWGYMNNKEVGTPIDAETTYGVSTNDNANGNFRFDNPTYFKTIEFYLNENDRNQSKIYTTLAFGNAQIEAQSHKQGDTYDRGMYKPSVTIPEGNEVLSYIIRCYDATTNQLVTLNDGIVAQGKGDPTKGEFQLDIEGLAEGKYYYEMEVVFNNSGVERTATVKSNPFTIYFPGVYTTETQSYQLLKLASEMNGYNYLTVAQDTEKGAIYAANLDAYSKVTAVAAITSEQRAAAVAQYENRDNLYTDRVLVIAPVPAQFKLDAEKSSAEMTIVNYSLDENANEVVNPQTDGSMAYVIQQGHMGNVNHKAVMNYTTTVDETVTPKQTMGKEVSTYMVRPNPVAGDAQVSVVRKVNGTTLGDKSVSYYKVNASKSFMDPNTMSVDVEYSIAGNTYHVTGGRAERGIAMTNLDPAATSQTTVVVKYRDAQNNYTLEANKFAPVEITSSEVAIKEGDRAITDAAITYAPPYSTKWGKLVSAITTFGFSETTAEKIGDTDLAVELYEPEVYVNGGETAYGFYTSDNDSRSTTPKAYFTADELGEMNASDPEAIQYYFDNGIGKDDNQTIETVKVTIAPVYPILVDPTVKVTGFDAPSHAPALKAESDDLAKLQNLYGKAAEKEINTSNDGIVTGINDIASKEVQSVRFVNVAGQMSDKPFEGVNIVVTKYTDGSTQAVKMVK